VDKIKTNFACHLFSACIRGLIDIVMVVDQSGSVNQCNFQKVKRWLRDIIRGFNIGKTEQDVGVVVYSSEGETFRKGIATFDNNVITGIVTIVVAVVFG